MIIFDSKIWNTPCIFYTTLSCTTVPRKIFGARRKTHKNNQNIWEISFHRNRNEDKHNFLVLEILLLTIRGGKRSSKQKFYNHFKTNRFKKSINQPYELSTYSQLWNRIAAPDWLLSFYCYFFIVPFEKLLFWEKKQISRIFKSP